MQIRALRLPDPQREYRFCVEAVGAGAGIRRRLKEAGLKDWRLDFYWVDQKLAVEVEGGGWTEGRHTRGSGFAEDLRKYHVAMGMGITVYRCDGALVRSGDAVELIGRLLEVKV